MMLASRLWTAFGLLVVGAKSSYGSAIHDYSISSRSTTHGLGDHIASGIGLSSSPMFSGGVISAGGNPAHGGSSESISADRTPSAPSNSWTASRPSTPWTIGTSTMALISPSRSPTPTLEQTTLSHTSTSWYSHGTIGSTTTHTLEQTIISHTSSSCYSNSTIGSTTTLYVPPPKNITTYPTTSSSTSTTTTIYVPTAITPSPTPPPSPCPTYCSISAGTVNLFFWPTNEPYTYPPTYVDTALDYTFTSPSVYMVVSTIFGYNSAGRAGPSGTSVVFALDLDQVSTIVPGGSATQQLTLNDLGTDCPQSEDASWIATAAPDGQCDPILVAPDPVKSWALPCNACGRFGLFDPPYAVPPLTGGLVPATTTAISTPVAPTPTPVSTTSSVITSSSYRDPNATIPMVTASSATKVTGGLACLILSLFVSVCLL